MSTNARPRKSKQRPNDLARRLAGLIEGRTVAKVLRLDDRELVVEFADGTRLFANSDARLDVSVTS
jgi:hypothetical protein